MNATCPTCGTTYRIDPAKVPSAGVRARCTRCEAVFRVAPERPEAAPAPEQEPEPEPAAEPDISPAEPEPTGTTSEPEPTVEPARPAPPAPFGVADPEGKARRLARALVSDIVVYHPDRRERSLRSGTLRQEFRDEIRKSWDEYVAQVGETLALRTPYFRDALNEILAGGEAVF